MSIPRRSVTGTNTIPEVPPEDRWLMYHPESDNVFLIHRKREKQQCINDGCEDVTGIKEYEEWFATGKRPPQVVGKQGEPLQIKYRPTKLSEVVGQKEAVKSLEAALKSKTLQHSFLFTGPSGCGKTTLSRIVARMVGCDPSNIIDTDAATNTGIDAMRDITSTLRYTGFGDSPNKMIILDEAHMLSKAAWTSLLKSVEEPPPHVFFAFCTTEEGKVPEAIKTRCLSYNLKPVRYDDIMDLLDDVVSKEGMKPLEGSLSLVARACDGSPRAALVLLEKIVQCESLEDVSVLLESPLENTEVIDLCRLMIKGDLTWKKLTETLKLLSEQNAESIRIVCTAYLTACLMGAKSDRDAGRLLDMLACFSRPCNPSDKLAPILLSFGEFVLPK